MGGAVSGVGGTLWGMGGAWSLWAGPGSSSQPYSPCCLWPGSPGSTPPQAPLHSLTGSLQSGLWNFPHTDSGWGRCRGPGLRSGPRSRLGQAEQQAWGQAPCTAFLKLGRNSDPHRHHPLHAEPTGLGDPPHPCEDSTSHSGWDVKWPTSSLSIYLEGVPKAQGAGTQSLTRGRGPRHCGASPGQGLDWGAAELPGSEKPLAPAPTWGRSHTEA